MVIAPTAVIIDLPNSLFMCAKAEIDQLQYEPWMLGANTVRKYKTLEVGKAGKHAGKRTILVVGRCVLVFVSVVLYLCMLMCPIAWDGTAIGWGRGRGLPVR